jgi:integrase
MAVYKRGMNWHMDVAVGGVRYREPLRTTDKREAKDLEKQRVAEILAGKGSSIAGRSFARLQFCDAADKLIEERKPHVAPRTQDLDRERSKPLRKHFGSRPLNRITAGDIATYQRARLDGAGFATPVQARTVNMELSVLRLILDRGRLWSRLKEDVKPLPEPSAPIGRALSKEELQHLFAVAGSEERWLVVRCAMAVALSTAGRGVELKGLRWENVDHFGMTLRFERSKTASGVRTIPLTDDAAAALAALRRRAETLAAAEPRHYVFFACERGVMNPCLPMKGWRTAWRSLVKEAVRLAEKAAKSAGVDPVEAGKPYRGMRFHDLRHCAVTMLAEAGVSDATLMSISGHLSKRMLDHYSHVRIQAKRDAVALLPTGLFSTEATKHENLAEIVN